MTTHRPAPNHHADHPGFAGPSGLVAALSMTIGRGAAARLATELVDLSPGDRLVDVGCGPGTAARVAARQGATVTGVDPAAVMLRVARAVPGGARITWRSGTAEDLPVEAGAATVLWSLATVHHWADVDRGLGEARRVLAPGGRFLAMERLVRTGATGLASHGWDHDQAGAFADALERGGFAEIAVTPTAAGRQRVLCVSATRASP
jgi:ubiquinone/menaquinone biosynthesis C-methylase UbiE